MSSGPNKETITYSGLKPDPFSQANILRTRKRIDTYMDLGRTIAKDLRPDQGEVTVNIPGKHATFRVLIVSDLHLFNISSDPKLAKQIEAEIYTPGTYVIFAGDLVEGIKAEHKETNGQTLLTFQQQIDTFRETWLKPMAKEGKVLTMVTRYNAHEGWPSDDGSLDAWASITKGVVNADGSRIPMVWNEGTLKLRFAEKKVEISLACYHQVSGSGTANNPVRPLRQVFVDQKIPRGDGRPRGGFAGHNHSRAGVSSERILAGDLEVQLFLLQNGTIKGLESDFPDTFLQKRAHGRVQPSGAAVVLRSRSDESGSIQVIPTYGYGRSNLLQRAMEIYNKTQSLGITQELATDYESRDGEVDLNLVVGESKIAERLGSFNSPLYKHLVWEIKSGQLGLPVRIAHMAHYPEGSGLIRRKEALAVVEGVAKSNHSLLLILNDTLDHGVPTRFNRRHILRNFARDMGKVPVNRRAGMMLGSIWRDDGWNKIIRNPADREDYDEPVVTGDELFLRSDLKGTQLFEGGGTVTFRLGRSEYHWYCIDGTGNFGSRQDPYLALIQMDRMSMVANDVVTGGHSVLPGALTMPDRMHIANGWFGPVFEKRFGKDSMIRAPLGGQGAVIMPNHGGKLIFGGGSDRELRETFEALTILTGATKMGQVEKIMTRKRR